MPEEGGYAGFGAIQQQWREISAATMPRMPATRDHLQKADVPVLVIDDVDRPSPN